MSNIKVGDLVEFINGNTYQGKLHNKVTSVSDCGDYIGINGKSTGTRRSWLKLVDKSKWHIHHDLIIAWAKGAEIESQFPNNTIWNSVKNPCWSKHYKYQIKPTEQTELEKLIQEHKAMGKTIDKLTKDFANG